MSNKLIIFALIPLLLMLYPYDTPLSGYKDSWENDAIDKSTIPYLPDHYPGGAYVDLPYGKTRYWLIGPEDGKKITLVHGIAAPAAIFTDIATDLAKKGYRVLAFDLYGRGYSASPSAPNTDALFVSQLAMLLGKIGWKKTDLLGLSLGGGIAVSFTRYFPEHVNSLILLAPVGLMDTIDIPVYARALKLPGVSSVLVNSFTRRLIETLLRWHISRNPDDSNDLRLKKLQQISGYQFANHLGFLNSFASTVRHFPFSDLGEAYEAVGKLNIKVLIIWGDKDTTVPYVHAAKVMSYIPHAKLVKLTGEGHNFHVFRPEYVVSIVHEFL
ncbi:11198_t:CDS:2, partial [Paraglomus occultum]